MNLKQKQLPGSNFSILQHRITQATYKKQPRKIRNLQRLLIKSLSIRIQTILIASQIKKITNRYSFFLDTEKRKSNHLEKKKQNFLIKQKKYLYSRNAYFVNKFSLRFYKKFFYYFLFFLFFFSKKKKNGKKEIINKKPSSEHSLHILSNAKGGVIPPQKGVILLNPLFLFICNLAFSPVLETLLQEKKEKIFRNSSELILFFKNFSNPSTEFIHNPSLPRVFFIKDKKKAFLNQEPKQKATSYQFYQDLYAETKQIDKRKLISTWILKLEIKGFFDYSNNSWLYENFPIEPIILKPLLKLMLNLYFFFKKKINSKNRKPKQRIKRNFLSSLTPKIKTSSVFFSFKKNQKQRKKINKKEPEYFLSLMKKKIFFKNKLQLFHKDFFSIWNNLNSKKNFFDNFCTNFDNFFSFCLIGLENYLKEIFYILNDFYFSEWYSLFFFENQQTSNFKKTNHVFYFPRFIYLTGLAPRQFKKIKKFINVFLKPRGLYLKNFTYSNFDKGVDLLGWNLKTKENDLIVSVSESFSNFQKKEIKRLIKNSNQEPIHKVIVKLNNKIKSDLIEYQNQKLYNILNFKNLDILYNDLNFFINQVFWKWAKKKHNNRSNIWIFQKYWGLRKIPISIFFQRNKNQTKDFLFISLKKNRNKKIQKEIIKNKRRIFVLLYSNESWKKLYDNFFLQNKTKTKNLDKKKKDEIFAQEESLGVRKNHFHLEYNIFKKYKNNLYFLNFYSLDFQTQYFFYIFSLP